MVPDEVTASLIRSFTVFAAFAVSAIVTSPSAAQEHSEAELVHWAYAATFGSGVYELGEDTEVLVFRVPFSWKWREPDPTKRCHCGVRFLFPVTLGLQDFDFGEVSAGEIPERIAQVSFLPGVELELPRTERWTLKVRAQGGWGTEIGDARDSAVLYAAGIRSRLTWPDRNLQPAWISGLQWSGYKPELGERQAMARLTNGVEVDVPTPRWQFRDTTMHLVPHVLNDWYFKPVDFLSISDTTTQSLDTEWEIGVSARPSRPFSIFGFAFDRVGLGFRYSEDSRGIRLLFGSIF